MKTIKKLAELVDEEIGMAERYAKLALKYQDRRPDLAKTMHGLSEQELSHAEKLQDAAQTILTEAKEEHADGYAAMQIVCDYLTERNAAWIATVKVMQDMFA